MRTHGVIRPHFIIIIVLYLTSVKIQINDKTNYKSHSLHVGPFTPKFWRGPRDLASILKGEAGENSN